MSKQHSLSPSFKYIKIKCMGIHVHACTHSKNTSSHTCCMGFVFVYSFYDGCTLTCPKTKQERSFLHPHNYNRLHQGHTVQNLLKLWLSFSEHEKILAGRNNVSYQVSTQSENLLYSPHIWYEYFCLEQGSNTCAILKYFFT